MASYTIVAKRLEWMDEDATWYRSRPPRRPHCIRRVSSASRKGHSTTPPFGPCLLWPRSPISATAELVFRVTSLQIGTVPENPGRMVTLHIRVDRISCIHRYCGIVVNQRSLSCGSMLK